MYGDGYKEPYFVSEATVGRIIKPEDQACFKYCRETLELLAHKPSKDFSHHKAESVRKTLQYSGHEMRGVSKGIS